MTTYTDEEVAANREKFLHALETTPESRHERWHILSYNGCGCAKGITAKSVLGVMASYRGLHRDLSKAIGVCPVWLHSMEYRDIGGGEEFTFAQHAAWIREHGWGDE